jgi:Hemerythrin HHE cation binding domain
MPLSAFRVLAGEHAVIRRQLERLDDLVRRGSPPSTVTHLVEQLVTTESRHEAVEAMFVWPAVRRVAVRGAELAQRGEGQETLTMWHLDRMSASDPASEGLVGRVGELADVMRSHLSFEEEVVWPALRARTTFVGVLWLGAELRLGRRVAPTRPRGWPFGGGPWGGWGRRVDLGD